MAEEKVPLSVPIEGHRRQMLLKMQNSLKDLATHTPNRHSSVSAY